MNAQSRSTSIVAIAMALILVAAGCSGASGLTRLDPEGAMEATRTSQAGGFPTTTVFLPDRARIRKVIVTPREPMRKFQVLVRTEPAQWKVVKRLDGRFVGNVTVSMDEEGDAVRIVNQNPARGGKVGSHVAGVSGAIETVLIYGRWLNGRGR